MSVALRLYEQLTEAQDEKTKARLIAEAFEQLEDRYPHLKEVATQTHVRESELRLQKEIEQTRLEIREVESRLQKEIKAVELQIKEVEGKLQKEIREVEGKLQKEIKEVELRLQKEIELTRLQIKEVEVKLQQTEVRTLQAIHRQTFWVIGSVGTIIGFIRLLDWFLGALSK